MDDPSAPPREIEDMNPVDRWWNRNFPTHSIKRLVFLCAASIPISAIVSWLGWGLYAGGFSWPFFIGLTVMVWSTVTISWQLARSGRVDLTASGIIRDESLDGPVPPAVTTATPTAPARTPRDYVISGAILFVGFAIGDHLLFGDEFGSTAELSIVLGSTVMTLLLLAATGFTLTIILVILAVACIPLAGLLQAFLSFGNTEGLFWYWLITFLFVAMFVLQFWFDMRSFRRNPRMGQIPMWATAVGTSLMFIFVGVISAGIGDDSSEAAVSPSPPGFVDPTPGGGNIGAPTREIASISLLDSWRTGDVEAARLVAQPRAVDALFSLPTDPSARFDGCGIVSGGGVRCVIATSNGLMLLGFQQTPDGLYHVSFFEGKPLDYPVDYEAYGGGGSPTP